MNLMPDDAEEFMTSSSSKSSRGSSLSSSNPHSRVSPETSSTGTETSQNSSFATLLLSSSDALNVNKSPESNHSCNKKFPRAPSRSSLIITPFKTLVGDQFKQGIPMSLMSDNELLLADSSMLRVVTSSELASSSSFRCSSSPVKSLLVKGDLIYTSHDDLKIRAWKKQDSQLILNATLPTLSDSIISSMLPGSHTKTRRHKRTLRIQHHDAISALALAPDGELLYSGSWDRTIKAWRTSDFRCVDSFQAHSDSVNHLLVSSKGDTGYYLYSGSSDGFVKVWGRVLDARKRNDKHTLAASFSGHRAGVNSLALSREEQYLFSGSGDMSIIVWEREESADHMSVRQVLRGHRGSVLCLAVASSLLCSGSADGTVRVWQRSPGSQHRWCCIGILGENTGVPVKSIVVFTEEPSTSLLMMNRFRVYARSLDGNLKVWCIQQPDDEKIHEAASMTRKDGVLQGT